MLYVRRYYSSREPITKEDNRVHGSGKVHSWKTCKKQMEAFAIERQLEVHGCRHTQACVCVCEYVYTFKAGTL